MNKTELLSLPSELITICISKASLINLPIIRLVCRLLRDVPNQDVHANYLIGRITPFEYDKLKKIPLTKTPALCFLSFIIHLKKDAKINYDCFKGFHETCNQNFLSSLIIFLNALIERRQNLGILASKSELLDVYLSRLMSGRIFESSDRVLVSQVLEKLIQANLPITFKALNYGINLSLIPQNLLHFACGQNQLEMVRILLLRGVSPLATNDKGATPLHVACSAPSFNIELIRLLLENKVDAAAVDMTRAPAHYYAHLNHGDIALESLPELQDEKISIKLDSTKSYELWNCLPFYRKLKHIEAKNCPWGFSKGQIPKIGFNVLPFFTKDFGSIVSCSFPSQKWELPSVETLDLSGGIFYGLMIYHDLFTCFPRLKSIDLSGSHINYPQSGSFISFITQLAKGTSVRLQDCFINRFPIAVYEHLCFHSGFNREKAEAFLQNSAEKAYVLRPSSMKASSHSLFAMSLKKDSLIHHLLLGLDLKSRKYQHFVEKNGELQAVAETEGLNSLVDQLLQTP